MSHDTPRRLTASDSLEILVGLTLLLGAVATWSPRVAIGALGAIMLGYALWRRRVA